MSVGFKEFSRETPREVAECGGATHEVPAEAGAPSPEAGRAAAEDDAPSALPVVRDGWARLVGIPAFGITIPLVTGLYGPVGPGDVRFTLGALWFLGLSAALWQGNRQLLLWQRARLDWLRRPYRKVTTLVLAVTLYTAPLTVAWLCAWYVAAGVGPVAWGTVQSVVLMNVICVLFVTHVYETVFLIRAHADDLLRVERLERARVEAELHSLEAQLDPHFLFNCLNTLGCLIESSPVKARAFNEGLASVYRYILRSRHLRLVALADELRFTRDYFGLLALRFGRALELELPTLRPEEARRRVPPLSVQLLVENAAKHNIATDAAPLRVRVTWVDGAIAVENARRPRELVRPGAGVGLRNLTERYRLCGAGEPHVHQSEDDFRVVLPTLEAR